MASWCYTLAVAMLLGCATDGATRTRAPQSPSARGFAHSLSAAFGAHDAKRLAALFATDAVVTLVGEARQVHGRDAIERAARAIFDRYPAGTLRLGRIWNGPHASLMEVLVSDGPIGVVGGCIVELDDTGLVTAERIYLDLMALVGQRAPGSLPEGIKVRAPIVVPPTGDAVFATQDPALEAANLAAANQTWAALDRHDAAAVMASASADYSYDDYAGPAALDREATQQLVARFVAALPDFTIAAKPVQFAVGDEVVTELVEHASFRGKAIVLHGVDVKQFRTGKVIREWQYANGAEAMMQLFDMAPLDPLGR